MPRPSDFTTEMLAAASAEIAEYRRRLVSSDEVGVNLLRHLYQGFRAKLVAQIARKEAAS